MEYLSSPLIGFLLCHPLQENGAYEVALKGGVMVGNKKSRFF